MHRSRKSFGVNNASSKMNVCLFTDSLEPSGVGQHMLTLVRELAPLHRLSVVCPPSPAGDRLLERARKLGVRTLALPVRTAAAEAELRTVLREQRTDVVHVHAGIGWEGHHGVHAARSAGVPVVRTEHLPYLLTDGKQRSDYAQVAASTRRIICVSAGVRDSYREVGISSGKLRVVRNGIHTESAVTVDRGEVRERIGLARCTPVALTVARFSEQKGHRDLLAAVPAVLSAVPEARFVWVGDGPLKAELRKEAVRRGLASRILFLGRRSDVPELLAAADVLVLPSLFEGLPLVALEAMAAALPVVGTRVCGTAEAVADGVTGRLVGPGDPPALARGIVEVLGDAQRARRWGAAGRARMAAEFGADRMARETTAIYAEVLELCTAQPPACKETQLAVGADRLPGQ